LVGPLSKLGDPITPTFHPRLLPLQEVEFYQMGKKKEELAKTFFIENLELKL
jgi:hypothetical protein